MNNPMKYTDPTGNIAWFIPVAIGAVVGAYAGASIYSGTAAFWHWKPGAWKGAIAGGIIGASLGYMFSAAIHANGLLATEECVKSIGASGQLQFPSKVAGTTSSILYSGSTNILFNGVLTGDWNSSWKAGISGTAIGAWGITGGMGFIKNAGRNIAGIAKKLGYQMTGTILSSIGDNWAKNVPLLSRVTLGFGPVNLTLGKGQRLFQWQDNIGNILFNSYGLANVIFKGATMSFDKANLSFCYTGGIADKLYDPDKFTSGFSPYIISGNKNLLGSDILSHELHHVWHSRALNNGYLFNYGLQGVTSLLLGGGFVTQRNYYETFVDEYKWW